jgi:hypothetical protein
MDYRDKYSDQQLIDMFLEWVNNYITITWYAESHGIGEVEALCVIEIGRDLHEASCITEEEK